MPFDLFISRASSFERIEKSGFFKKPKPITAGEFQAVMHSENPVHRPDGDLWIRHPDENEPWFATRLTPKGAIVLSCSYTCNRYIRNYVDAFDLGLEIADSLNANLFEEVRGTHVTRDNIDALLANDGDYLKMQVASFKNALELLSSSPGGPLEFPLGPVDLVSEYCVFHLQSTGATLPTIALVVKSLSTSLKVLSQSATDVIVSDESERPLVKVFLRPDGKLQIWPYHGYAPFSLAASTTLMVALAAANENNLSATFNGNPLDPALLNELRSRVRGLGVEFYEWASA